MPAMPFSLDPRASSPYFSFTIFFIFTIIAVTLLYIVIPITLWVRHKRMYAHYNVNDHLRELELSEWKDDDDDDAVEDSSGEDGIEETQRGEQGSGTGNVGDGVENQQASSSGSFIRTGRQGIRRSRRRRDQQQSGLQDLHHQSYMQYYYNSFWTRQLQPDQAMKQLLVLWYFCSSILIVGMCLCTVYRKSVADMQLEYEQRSDYYGEMQVLNVSIVPVESIERFRFNYFRIFHAEVKLEVTWECQDASEEQQWTCDASLMYDSCIQGHNCHEYLLGQVREETENITNPVTEYCLEEDKQETMQEAQECIDGVISMQSGDGDNATTSKSIYLYGDCDSCLAYETIPSTSSRSQERLKYNGTFFMVMGGLAMVWWVRTNQRYREKLFPKPPEWSGGNNDAADPDSSDSGSDNGQGENGQSNTERQRRRRTRRNSSFRNNSNNDPIQNRIENESARQRQRSQSPPSNIGSSSSRRHFHRNGAGEPQELMSVVARHYQRAHSSTNNNTRSNTISNVARGRNVPSNSTGFHSTNHDIFDSFAPARHYRRNENAVVTTHQSMDDDATDDGSVE